MYQKQVFGLRGCGHWFGDFFGTIVWLRFGDEASGSKTKGASTRLDGYP